MGRVVPAGSVDWAGLFGRFEHTCFRLETLQRYDEPGEADAFRSFLAGQEPASYPGKEAWLAIVRAAVTAGKVMQRVHVVAEPLTDYLRFETGWGVFAERRGGRGHPDFPGCRRAAWHRLLAVRQPCAGPHALRRRRAAGNRRAGKRPGRGRAGRLLA